MKEVVRHSYKDGEISETRTLRFLPFYYSEEGAESMMMIIRNHLTPDLLTKKYREENLKNPMYGHCYHATQALFYLLDPHDLIPMSGIDYRGDTHWWLYDDRGVIYDTTADQYYSVGQVPPHNVGKKTNWYGWKQRPHQRSLDLMMRILYDCNIEYCYETTKPLTEVL